MKSCPRSFNSKNILNKIINNQPTPINNIYNIKPSQSIIIGNQHQLKSNFLKSTFHTGNADTKQSQPLSVLNIRLAQSLVDSVVFQNQDNDVSHVFVSLNELKVQNERCINIPNPSTTKVKKLKF